MSIFAYAQHPDPLAGFSVVFEYSCRSLEMLETSYTQTFLGHELGNAGLIDFFFSTVYQLGNDRCQSRTAAIFHKPQMGEVIECPLPTLEPSPDDLTRQSIVRYRIKVNSVAGMVREYQDLMLDETGSFNLTNMFLIDNCPTTPVDVTPQLVHGKIYFSLGGLEGRVVEAMSEDPVAGARIVTEPERYEGMTRGDGTFTLPDMIPGRYSLRITKAGFYSGLFGDVEVNGKWNADDAGRFSIYATPTSPCGGEVRFRRGDSNSDGGLDLSDAVFTLNYLFLGGAPPTCFKSADSNDDGKLDLSDAVTVLNFMFIGGEQPRDPYSECGLDPSEDDLTCAVFLPCQ